MGISWLWQAAVAVILSGGAQLAAGLLCHTCSLEVLNEVCNANYVTCSGAGDVCYTTVDSMVTGNKRFTKGCMSGELCTRLEGLNSPKYCLYPSSQCTYCCSDPAAAAGSGACNAHNAGVHSTARGSGGLIVAGAALVTVTWIRIMYFLGL